MASKREQNKKEMYEYFQDIAKNHGGKVISLCYENMHSKMTFECKQGHVFSAKCHDIKQKGTWCSVCAGNAPLSVDKLRNFAASYKGVLLSPIYLGLTMDHEWACFKGHQFTLSAQSVLYTRSWCPICQKESKKKIRRNARLKEIQNIAAEKGGRIISDEYINSRAKILCECKDGSRFTSSYEKVKRGEWGIN